jgi:putative transposase
MSQVVSPSMDECYGLARVLRTWDVSRSTFYAKKGRPSGSSLEIRPGKRGPVGSCDDTALTEHIRQALKDSPFHGEGHRKVWAKLRRNGVRTSKERVLRLMRKNDLLAPGRVGHPHGPRAHDGHITTENPNDMWGTDITGTLTVREGNANVFVAVDHCTMECVGIHASKSGNRFEALEPIRQGTRERFGSVLKGIADGVSIRHDHGSAYLSNDFQKELTFLGMESSPSFVREPEGNGCAEWFIRILKENLLWVEPFETVEELRLALIKFKELYNSQWLIERHGFQTPTQARERHEAGQKDAA